MPKIRCKIRRRKRWLPRKICGVKFDILILAPGTKTIANITRKLTFKKVSYILRMVVSAIWLWVIGRMWRRRRSFRQRMRKLNWMKHQVWERLLNLLIRKCIYRICQIRRCHPYQCKKWLPDNYSLIYTWWAAQDPESCHHHHRPTRIDMISNKTAAIKMTLDT